MVIDLGKDLIIKYNDKTFLFNSKEKKRILEKYPYFKAILNKFNSDIFCFRIENFKNKDVETVLDNFLSDKIDFDNSDQELLFIILTGRPSNFPTKFLQYNNDSCFLDTLLVVMFESISNFWRTRLFNTNINRIKYEKSLGYNRELDVKENALELQKELYDLFLDLHGYAEIDKFYCRNVRSILGNYVKNINSQSQIDEVYSAFYTHFPDLGLKFSYDPDYITSSFIASDYMYENDFAWDLYDDEVLIFINTNFLDLELDNPKGKINYFNFKIIDFKYELIAVVNLRTDKKINQIEEKGSGGHYTCYFKSYDNNWYFYDDLKNGKFVKIKDIEEKREQLFHVEDKKIPVMLFYQKI